MSSEMKKQLTDFATWSLKGLAALAAGFALFIFNDVREDVQYMREKMEQVSEVVIRHDGQIERNKADIERLFLEKVNK